MFLEQKPSFEHKLIRVKKYRSRLILKIIPFIAVSSLPVFARRQTRRQRTSQGAQINQIQLVHNLFKGYCSRQSKLKQPKPSMEQWVEEICPELALEIRDDVAQQSLKITERKLLLKGTIASYYRRKVGKNIKVSTTNTLGCRIQKSLKLIMVKGLRLTMWRFDAPTTGDENTTVQLQICGSYISELGMSSNSWQRPAGIFIEHPSLFILRKEYATCLKTHFLNHMIPSDVAGIICSCLSVF